MPKGAFVGDASTPVVGEPVDPDPPTVRPVDAEHHAEIGSIVVRVTESHAHVVLVGEIDADMSPDLHRATHEVSVSGLPVEIDARHVSFMDSTGVAFLGGLTAVTPGPVRIHNTPPTVRFLLEVTSIGTMLEIVDDPGTVDATSSDREVPHT